MSATDQKGARRPLPRALRYGLLGGFAWTVGVASLACANDSLTPKDTKVATLLKARLPKTVLTKVDCAKVAGLCEVTSGANLFYVDGGGRYLVIGRVYDMETRQDLTATRLLEINPDLLVGGAARASASADSEAAAAAGPELRLASAPKPSAPSPARRLPVETLPTAGAIVWGNPTGKTVTVFSDFRCGYCRALTNTLKGMNLRVVERPISVLGSRDIANRVYCAKDRKKALHAAYAGETIPAGPTCDTSGLDANERFAKAHGLGGTPVIVRADGAMIEGFRPRQVLVSWIAGGKA